MASGRGEGGGRADVGCRQRRGRQGVSPVPTSLLWVRALGSGPRWIRASRWGCSRVGLSATRYHGPTDFLGGLSRSRLLLRAPSASGRRHGAPAAGRREPREGAAQAAETRMPPGLLRELWSRSPPSKSSHFRGSGGPKCCPAPPASFFQELLHSRWRGCRSPGVPQSRQACRTFPCASIWSFRPFGGEWTGDFPHSLEKLFLFIFFFKSFKFL